MKTKKYVVLIIALVLHQLLIAQNIPEIDYSNPIEYEIGGIQVEGLQYLDAGIVKTLAGLKIGEKIMVPSNDFSKAIDNIWKQGLFENITIGIESIEKNIVYLKINLTERPRLTSYKVLGIKKGLSDNIKELINITRGDVVTSNEMNRISYNIKKHFIDKGYYNIKTNLYTKRDTSMANNVLLYIDIDLGAKVRIYKIKFDGNKNLTSGQLKRTLKNTKEQPLYKMTYDYDSLALTTLQTLYKHHSIIAVVKNTYSHFLKRSRPNFLRTSRFKSEDWQTDQTSLISKYNELGYRDAKVIHDTIYLSDPKKLIVKATIDEGKQYFFKSITIIGNTKYTTADIQKILALKKGDVYNQKALDKNLYMNMEGGDISSLYLDNGYLFFSVTPVEVNVENDSIDLEIRIYEGSQARINRVYITGNTKTNDHVILREVRTRPGELFSRSDIIRTQRELAQLKYFDQEKLGVNPKPNPQDGTVDIEYTVEEVSSDQVELSGGWGAGRLIGTLGVSFNNFSTRNFFEKGAWTPLPSGDGQKLSLRAQSNGQYYQSYNASFTEPWLGGKKPNAFSLSMYHSVQNFNGKPRKDSLRQGITINGLSVGLGKRIKWPDDYFTLYGSISFQNYHLFNYEFIPSFKNGNANNLSVGLVFSRNSIDAPIYPRTGSEISISASATPPYSVFSNKNFADLTAAEKYHWTEYHKWKIKTSYYAKVVQNLVFSARAGFGYIGMYNKNYGITPFGRFYLGGDGLTGYALDDREVIAMRGYENSSLTPEDNSFTGGAIYNKYTMELRYPLSLNPSATIFVLAFAEAGNAWLNYQEYNPFNVKRSFGAGFRIFLPMFGLLGLDWGYGFDDIPNQPGASGPQFHFSIGQSID